MLAIYPSDICRCSCASYTWGSFLLQHDSWRCCLSSQPSNQFPSTMCWSCLGDNHRHSRSLYIKTPFLARHNSRHAVCLHSPQTRVCTLCSGTLGSINTTLSIAIHLRNSQTRVCPLHDDVPFLVTTFGTVVRFSVTIFFTPSMTLGIAVFLHSP